ncbi:redoxin domain-containing protein, partial [Sphingobacterium wenxiniae]|uniref:redoxin domain-containing protein n=1 Tax=Sphingobacterium wenxiniae TaxID=683125 RepID=UPI001BAF11DC
VYKNMAFSHKKGLVQLSGEQYCQEPPTRNILDSLKPTAYSLLLIFVSMFSLSDAWAQSVEIRTAERQNISHIKGKIKSKYTNVPIEGACVKLIGGSETAFSNREGDFTISTIKAEGQLQVSVSGYENALVAFSEGRLDNSKSTIHLVKILKQSDAFSVGDNLPEHWWREQFNVFNHPFSRSKVTLLEYREPELFILDFWAPWCKPCIAAIDEWQQFLNENSVADIAVLAVNVGLYDRSEIFMHKRGWNIPSLYGEETLALSRQFFSEDQVGGQVWILNGKVVFIGHKRDRVKEMERLNMILGSIKEGRQK